MEERKDKVITIGAGQSATNNGKIVTNGVVSKGDKTFSWIKREVNDTNFNICFYAMAALEEDTGINSKEDSKTCADNATLMNNGIISMRFNEILAEYKERLKSDRNQQKEYDIIFAWGMFAGKHSSLVNNGSILIDYDEEDIDSTYTLFSHPMYIGSYSSLTNNGTVSVTGKGSLGAQVRGLIVGHSNVKITNNAKLFIDVAHSFATRALGATEGSSVVNIGSVYAKSDKALWGISILNGATPDAAVNLGEMTVISEGRFDAYKYKVGYQVPVVPGAFGISGCSKKGGACTFSNRGILRAAIQGDNAKPFSVANGILVYNSSHSDSETTVINTGKIEVSSSAPKCTENQNIVRVAELGINSFNQKNGKFQREHVKVKEFATTLRDFAETKDFIQAYKAVIDFSEATLILRSAEDYVSGTAYTVSKDTLVTKIYPFYVDLASNAVKNVTDSGVTDYEVSVVGMGTLRFAAAEPDLFTVDIIKNGDDDDASYLVSLVPVASKK